MASNLGNRCDDDFQQFCELRADSSLDDQRFAERVCKLDLFIDKFTLAAATLRGWRRMDEEARQEAIFGVLGYLAKTRGRQFTGTSADALGGWFYCLSKRHIRWMRQNLDRHERRQRHHEQAAARPLTLYADLDSSAITRADLIEAILKLSARHRLIVNAILRGEEITTTLRRLGICRRTYYRLRKEALDLLRKLLSDDDDCSSLVPA